LAQIDISAKGLNEWGEGVADYESVVKPTHEKFAEMYKDSLTLPVVFEDKVTNEQVR
jgi:hypothetical protein